MRTTTEYSPTDSRALCHPGRPLDLTADKCTPEELLVELDEEGVEVGGRGDRLPFVGHERQRLGCLLRCPILGREEVRHLAVSLLVELILQQTSQFHVLIHVVLRLYCKVLLLITLLSFIWNLETV